MLCSLLECGISVTTKGNIVQSSGIGMETPKMLVSKSHNTFHVHVNLKLQLFHWMGPDPVPELHRGVESVI